ncbi:MAG: hypothetical protein HYS87_03740 [Candidatus Colwellbacteria bacterium]|nr:hypothetical protein [Candidatus Colwellbacteria bacterium]
MAAVIVLVSTVAFSGCVAGTFSGTSTYVHEGDLVDFISRPANSSVYQKVGFAAQLKDHPENKGFELSHWGWQFGDEERIRQEFQRAMEVCYEEGNCSEDCGYYDGNCTAYFSYAGKYEPCLRDQINNGQPRYGPKVPTNQGNWTKNPTTHFYCEAGEYEVVATIWSIDGHTRFMHKSITVSAA